MPFFQERLLLEDNDHPSGSYLSLLIVLQNITRWCSADCWAQWSWVAVPPQIGEIFSSLVAFILIPSRSHHRSPPRPLLCSGVIRSNQKKKLFHCWEEISWIWEPHSRYQVSYSPCSCSCCCSPHHQQYWSPCLPNCSLSLPPRPPDLSNDCQISWSC